MTAFDQQSSGPSRTGRAPDTSDLLGSSPDFGDFTSAPTHDDVDLLGSFDDPTPLSRPPIPSRATHIDLLSGDDDDNGMGGRHIRVPLPPRPSEISPDYVPPLRSPRRMKRLSFAGPSSPPQVSNVGMDTLFHPSMEQEKSQGRDSTDSVSTHSTAQSKLFNTLATSKIASKWKSVLDQNTHSSNPIHAQSPTAQTIDVTHSTPFGSLDHHADVYCPPSGAPGFRPESAKTDRSQVVDEEWKGTHLVGRRDMTVAVLTATVADQVRNRVQTMLSVASQSCSSPAKNLRYLESLM